MEGQISREEYSQTILTTRQELTGADRQWASCYEVGDIIRYSKGSRALDLAAGAYVRVISIDGERNLLTVRRENGREVTYDPRRLQGVGIYREAQRQLSSGDRIQFTAPYKGKHVANRQLGTIEQIDAKGNLRVRLDSGRSVDFSIRKHPHLDYGYAVTSHSAQGATADRVLIHVDSATTHRELINSRLAYVAVSRARYDARIYTGDGLGLGSILSRSVSKDPRWRRTKIRARQSSHRIRSSIGYSSRRRSQLPTRRLSRCDRRVQSWNGRDPHAGNGEDSVLHYSRP